MEVGGRSASRVSTEVLTYSRTLLFFSRGRDGRRRTQRRAVLHREQIRRAQRRRDVSRRRGQHPPKGPLERFPPRIRPQQDELNDPERGADRVWRGEEPVPQSHPVGEPRGAVDRVRRRERRVQAGRVPRRDHSLHHAQRRGVVREQHRVAERADDLTLDVDVEIRARDADEEEQSHHRDEQRHRDALERVSRPGAVLAEAERDEREEEADHAPWRVREEEEVVVDVAAVRHPRDAVGEDDGERVRVHLAEVVRALPAEHLGDGAEEHDVREREPERGGDDLHEDVRRGHLGARSRDASRR
eukprot:31482-Pelagococcus_subviridis.AAC.12